MLKSQPRIPVEIIDNIVDEIIAALDRQRAALSAMALVARRWRHRVNQYRFSTLRPGHYFQALLNIDSYSARLHALADLLRADVWPQDDGIAQHVRSVDLDLVLESFPSPGDPELRLAQPFQDGSLAAILRAVFRGDKGRYTFSLSWQIGYDLTTIHPELMEALQDLCCSSRLTDLRLRHLYNFPSALLCSPTITALDLQQVHFKGPLGHTEDYVLPKLKELKVEMSPSFLDVALREAVNGLPALTKLTCDINDYVGFTGRLSGLKKKLATLEIFIRGRPVPIPYSPIRLSALQTLDIEYDVRVVGRTDVPPAFLNIFNIMPNDFPPFLHIQIKMHAGDYNPLLAAPCTVLDSIYHKTIYHPSLVGILERSCPSKESSVSIRITIVVGYELEDHSDTQHIVKEYKAHARELFSKLYAIRGLDFDFTIKPVN